MPIPAWFAGEDLLHDVWPVATDTNRRQPAVNLSFNDVVSPGGGRLNDPEYECLHIYAKTSAARSDLFAKNGKTSLPALKVGLSMDKVLIRWMVHKNVRRLCELRPEHFDMFIAGMRRGVFDGLLPMRDRIEAFLADVKAGRKSIGSFHDNGALHLDQRAIAHELGLSSASFGRLPGHLKFLLLDHLRENDPELYDIAVWTGCSTGRSRADQAKETMTFGGLLGLLGPWDRMAKLAPFMPGDRLSFQPFNLTCTRWGLARFYGVPNGRTRDIPPPAMLHLIDRALHWISNAEALLDCMDAYDRAVRDMAGSCLPAGERLERASAALQAEIDRIAGGTGPVLPAELQASYVCYNRNRARAAGELDLRTALSVMLPGAAFSVIGAMSARRISELFSIKSGCLSKNVDGHWLEVWISKVLSRLDRIPVPRVVGMAVAALERLSAAGRAKSGVDWLSVFAELNEGGKAFGLDIPAGIKAFSAFVGTPANADGSPFNPTPHMFRRAFAISYFWRYRHPSLAALSHFFRHSDPEMTRIYVTTHSPGQYLRLAGEADASDELRAEARAAEEGAQGRRDDFEAEHRRFMCEVFRLSALGLEPLGGLGGLSIGMDLDLLVAECERRVVLSTAPDIGAALDGLLSSFVEGRSLMPHPDGHTYCKCTSSPSELKLSACLERKRCVLGDEAVAGASEPDKGYADALTCGECPHGVQLPENGRSWEAAARAEADAAERAATPHLAAVHADRAAKLRAGYQKWHARRHSAGGSSAPSGAAPEEDAPDGDAGGRSGDGDA